MLYIKEWKENEIAIDNNGGFLESVNGIERETEKAYLLSITWAYTSDLYKHIKVWVPKSATMTEEEYDAQMKEAAERMENGLAYNAMLREFAKENGIKGIRERMRTATIIEKIKNAGLEVPAREVKNEI